MKVNGKEYNTPSLNFAAVCKLEEWGLSVDNLAARPLALLAGFVSIATGGSTLADGEAAIDAHLTGGGDLSELTEALNGAINASGFFGSQTGQSVKD